ncbi:Gfo/Idh/MocA family protein [Mesorhizobium sp. 131-2-1]|uniref:Gfo/Idh/MocA family protein n=1 Tax=Mesorhizobium sp. 131-2-1 TaxID=2744518 RepID=UPI0019254AFB|nr:Gfo/Idh/MocA family oxidoreductase [Mesorhizobium sp. 131-2-1]BCG95440.1 oxidoreductase [Mesorhizobium sp. 131-2-1]
MSVRIGLIGAGWVTRHHLDAWRALSGRATVVAIADPSAEAREERAAQYAIPKTYADAADMLAAESLDAVDIASPRELHAAHVRLAAAAGLAILCQKPLARSFAEAEALVDEIGDRVPFMVHENWRFRPHYRLISRWLDEAGVGRPLQAQMSVLTSGLVPDARGELQALKRQPMLAGLKQMLVKEILIHHIDTLRFLFGDLSLRSAAVGRLSDAVIGDDHALLSMTTADGAPVILQGNLHARGYPGEVFDWLEIFCEHGRILLDRDRLTLQGKRSETVSLDLAANYAASYRDTIACFLDGLAAGRILENRPADNLGTLRIVDEAYRWRRPA